jgi:hypothetical protein
VHVPTSQRHQIVKCGALAGERHARVRPIELAQKRCRIEDALRRALRPLTFHQTDEKHLVELAVARRLGIDKLHARMAGARRERLPFDPSANHGGDGGKLDRCVVEILVGPAQPMNR